jgi:HPr kinase/phosphorylase
MSTALTISSLFQSLREKLDLKWIIGQEFENKAIHTAGEDLTEISLVGSLNLINHHRIQVIGAKELEYLENLKKNSRTDALSQLCSDPSKLVIMAKNLPTPDDLKEIARKNRTAILGSAKPSQETVQALQFFLSRFFAEKIMLHGVFMEVIGTGVLITGESSIGKSELALELLSRGHRLIADDATEVARTAPDTLNGTCPEMLRDFLEVRGLGILNVRAMFGDSSIKQNRNLRLIIVLKDILESEKMDRLQGSKRTRTILDIGIPEITLPVAPGRNLSVLVEAAVRNHRLATKGYDASKAFIARQKDRLEKIAR